MAGNYSKINLKFGLICDVDEVSTSPNFPDRGFNS